MKYIIVSFLFTNSVSYAASTGTLLLKGQVPVINDLVVTPNGQNANLNIIGGENNKLVASVAESSNNLAGFKVYISSPTGGELRHSQDASKKTTYSISYNGSAAVTPSVAGVMVKNISSLSALTTSNSNVNINVSAYASAPAGFYQDTLTFSIQAN